MEGSHMATFHHLTLAYLQAAIWADLTIDDKGTPDDEATLNDIAPESLAEADTLCRAFADKHAGDIDGWDARAGHDLWLTRNRHGAGFWDGDGPEPAATRLTDAAHALGEATIYRGDDGKIHID